MAYYLKIIKKINIKTIDKAMCGCETTLTQMVILTDQTVKNND